MNVLRTLLVWLAAFLFICAIDAVWHLVLFGRQYAAGLRPLARMKGDKFSFHPAAGLLAQVLVVSALLFLVMGAVKAGDYRGALRVGMAAGTLAISVYGVTNFALLRDWSLTITILEVVWGPILGGLSASFILFIRGLLG